VQASSSPSSRYQEAVLEIMCKNRILNMRENNLRALLIGDRGEIAIKRSRLWRVVLLNRSELLSEITRRTLKIIWSIAKRDNILPEFFP